MRERVLGVREAEEQLEDVSSEQQLAAYLNSIAAYVGWVIIYFNSLEDAVTFYLRQQLLRDPYQDERLDVFLSEMMFAGKSRALVNLYGQRIGLGAAKAGHADLTKIEALLQECSKRRNEYAHADWIGLKKARYVRVKASSSKRGLVHRYKKYTLQQVRADVTYLEKARRKLDAFNERIND